MAKARLLSVGVVMFCLASTPPWAQPPGAPGAPALAFDDFVRATGPICLLRPAPQCVDASWRFADADADRALSLDEVLAVRGALEDWSLWRAEDLAPKDRTAINFGLFIADVIGVENLFDAYDTNADDRLSRAELLADVTLDGRPIGQILVDPQAVDREAVRERLGKAAPMLEGLLRSYDES
ncbi:MAG: hypothetical protein ACE5Q3_02825 [Alphaproteobacteria bacterium]